MKKAHIFISGFVQGVGFRQFIKKTSEDRELTGWARNLPDGRVEALFEGEEDDIEQEIKDCSKGPFLCEIEDIVVEWMDSDETFPQFRIIRD